MSSGNPNNYTNYPNLAIAGQLQDASDSKRISLQQTLLYRVFDSFDLLAAGVGSYLREESNTGGTFHSTGSTHFDSLWVGGMYTAPTFYNFSPQLTLQVAPIQREKFGDQSKNFYLHSASAQFALKSYSDPAVYSLYVGTTYNAARKFEAAKIHYGNSYFFGIDLSIILSPKVSLDVGLKETFQTESKINGMQTSNLYSLPSFSLGVTYSLTSDTAIAVSGSMSGVSAAPDSVFGLTLWKKF